MPERKPDTAWTVAQERAALGALILLLAVLWLGFLVHRSPLFAGSLTGGVLAVTGATLMVVFSVAYAVVKRLPRLKQSLGSRLGMGLLRWHVYTGALGAVLAILHTGHRFESDVGVAVTATMIATVLSGYVGRHLLGRISRELREKQGQLARLVVDYNELASRLSRSASPVLLPVRSLATAFFHRSPLPVAWPVEGGGAPSTLALRAVSLAESIAEAEYSIRSHERFKKLAALWLGVHIVFALGFYVLLALHVWAALHFGLRWFA